jgi:molybdopterin biosynthesis enzyme MoaB
VTPEATRDVIEREAPGFGEEMRRRSAEVIATAAVSRATAGTLGRTLVLNLPGSPRGAVECLSFLHEPVLHAIHLLTSDTTDCAS